MAKLIKLESRNGSPVFCQQQEIGKDWLPTPNNDDSKTNRENACCIYSYALN